MDDAYRAVVAGLEDDEEAPEQQEEQHADDSGAASEEPATAGGAGKSTASAGQLRLGDDVRALVESFVDPAGETERLLAVLRREVTSPGRPVYIRTGYESFLNPRVGAGVRIKYSAVRRAVTRRDYASPLIGLYLECGGSLQEDCKHCKNATCTCVDEDCWSRRVKCAWLGQGDRPVAAAYDGKSTTPVEAVILAVQVETWNGRPGTSEFGPIRTIYLDPSQVEDAATTVLEYGQAEFEFDFGF